MAQAALAALLSAAALPQEMLRMILRLVEISCCKAPEFNIILQSAAMPVAARLMAAAAAPVALAAQAGMLKAALLLDWALVARALVLA